MDPDRGSPTTRPDGAETSTLGRTEKPFEATALDCGSAAATPIGTREGFARFAANCLQSAALVPIRELEYGPVAPKPDAPRSTEPRTH